MKKILYILLLSFSFTATLLVPDDFATIQEAIDYSIDGDTILVSAGTYYENIQINKYLYFISNDGPESTFIDGGGNNGMASNVSFNINGFSFINCHEGINISWVGPLQVSNCIFNNNTTAIFSKGTNIITLSNSLFYDNNSGFVQDYYGSTSFISNCTFNNNIDINWNPYWTRHQSLDVYNSIFLGQISGNDLSPVNLYYSNFINDNLLENVNDIFGNSNHDPLFIDLDSDDYSLSSNSPCVDAGDSISLSNDIDGSRNDMGYTGGNGTLINKSNINFGYVPNHITSESTVWLLNKSNNEIVLNDFESSNSQFSIIESFPLSISPGELINLNFSYNPLELGHNIGIITIYADGLIGDSSISINVSSYSIDYNQGLIQVPEIAPTIQSAIDIASNNDTILVNNGIYYENLFTDKELVLLSVSGSNNTVIDGNEDNGLQIFKTGQIDGFTLTNCNKGIDVRWQSGPYKVSNCIFSNNNIGFKTEDNGSINLLNSLFYDNNYGFFHDYYGSDSYIENCTFNNNVDIKWDPYHASSIILEIKNSIIQNIIYGNDLNPVNLYYSNYVNGVFNQNVNDILGNISIAPLFVDSGSENYNLQSNSPCIDTGDPQSELDPDGTRTDMGMYPFYQNYINFNLDSILLYDIDNSTDYEYTMFANSSVQNIGGIQFEIYDISDYINFNSIVSHLDIFDLVYGNEHENGSYSVVMLNTNQIEFPLQDPLEELPLITFNFNLNYANSDFEFGEDVQIDLGSPLAGSFDAVPINTSFSYGAISIGYQGDISQDGIINVYDLITGIWFILEENYPTDYEFWASDINSDGDINIYDLLILINIILGN